jgi:hypothetical protein
MNNLIPQWLDLQSAVAYLTNKTKEEWAIPSLLELGRVGKLPMYAIVPEDSYIQYWDMSDTKPLMREKEISDFLPVTTQHIQKIQKFYPASGYSISIEAPLPKGCSYDLPEHWPILMRMDSKGFSRGMVIKSHEAIRILGKELQEFLSQQECSAIIVPEVIKGKADEWTEKQLLELFHKSNKQGSTGLTKKSQRDLAEECGISQTRIGELLKRGEILNNLVSPRVANSAFAWSGQIIKDGKRN